MPTPTTEDIITAEKCKKIIREKCPPETERDRIYSSILISLAERLDAQDARFSVQGARIDKQEGRLESTREETKKAVSFLAESLASALEPEAVAGDAQDGGGGAAAPKPGPQRATAEEEEEEGAEDDSNFGEKQNTSRVTGTAPIPPRTAAQPAPPPPAAPNGSGGAKA